jgi:hypothetical protein
MASPLSRGAEPDRPAGGGSMASPLSRGAEPDRPAGGGSAASPWLSPVSGDQRR